MTTMPSYHIVNTTTGEDHGVHEGDDDQRAMDAMARANGYTDRYDMLAEGPRSRDWFCVTKVSADLDYERVRAIVGALLGHWRMMTDKSGNVFEIERDGRREVRTVWIDGCGTVHDVDVERLKGGDLVLASGRRVA